MAGEQVKRRRRSANAGATTEEGRPAGGGKHEHVDAGRGARRRDRGDGARGEPAGGARTVRTERRPRTTQVESWRRAEGAQGTLPTATQVQSESWRRAEG